MKKVKGRKPSRQWGKDSKLYVTYIPEKFRI